ncbi:hypothetical protein [Flavihumibacter petaseus]|nr:hypothetical protein [Flavihumibacter petaseus]
MSRSKNLVLLLLVWTTIPCYAQSGDQEKLGLPGDNLNLYAVMRLFQESPTLEEFEKKLNEENSQVNNLDLDGDDKIDYIKVNDEVQDGVHNIVLQVAVNESENQDVAVFTVDKDRDGNVNIQLTGDEELYGKNYIIEPNTTAVGSTPNPGYTGSLGDAKVRKLDDKEIVVNHFSTVEIRTWPIVEYIFVPSYVVWRSPWYWGYYPGWWRPWRPWYWDYYYGYHYNFYNYYWGWYRPVPFHRYPYWNDYYYRRNRRYSPYVYNRRMGGYYQQTYSRPEMRRDGMAHYNKVNPSRPVLKPGLNRPAPKPAVRPNPGVTRPVTPTRPVTKPTNPRPVNPGPTNPVTRPVNPKPTNPKPVNPKPTNPRPTPKPVNPSPKPVNPSPKPATRPAPKPAPKPVPRPANPSARAAHSTPR